MKMKANNNNNITDYYLALFSSINCATAPDNRNKKMAIILPTGQWYAPSSVINDAWYCMVLHCIA